MNDMFLIDKITKEKKIHFYNSLPKFIKSIIKFLLHENEVNHLLSIYKEYTDIEFIDKILKHLKITLEFQLNTNIKTDKKYIFVCNHPTGILDGLVILTAIII